MPSLGCQRRSVLYRLSICPVPSFSRFDRQLGANSTGLLVEDRRQSLGFLASKEVYGIDMAQFGSDTLIRPTTRFIICDCFDTLVQSTPDGHVPRIGVSAFISWYKQQGATFVVHSDAKKKFVKRALNEAGLLKEITSLYHADNAMLEPTEDQPVGLKNLAKPLADFRIDKNDAVFIGDSPLDARAAQLFEVPFIRVPRSEDPDFSFTTLISGPSRYRSSVFMEKVWKV